jgi:hypothetical protein
MEMQGYGDAGLWRCRAMEMQGYEMHAYEMQGLWGCEPTEMHTYEMYVHEDAPIRCIPL